MRSDFNRDWEFSDGEHGFIKVTLPHDAMITERRHASCLSGVGGAFFKGGKYTYKKTFTISEKDIGKKISLLFEGVYRNAVVRINGKEVTRHAYGYSEFVADISKAVKSRENEVEVLVDNSLVPNCRWYSGSGIYRPVLLDIASEETPEVLKVETISYEPSVIKVEADESSKIVFYDEDRLVASGEPGLYTIQNAKLWSDEQPYLYKAVATKGDESIETLFGIRKIELDPKKGLLINGKRTLLRGGCIHHDNGVLGACSFPDAEERRIRILKENGFNAIRCAHNSASRYLLDACDRYGMYVLDECFDGWYIPKDYHDYSRDFMTKYKEDLKAMAEKDFNHPSVIMYSIGNEVTETVEDKGIKLCGEMRDILHSLDATRPVTCGINVLLDVYVKFGMGVYKDKGEYKRELLPENNSYKEKKSGSAFFNMLAGKLGGLMFFMSKGRTAEKIVSKISPSLDIMGLNYASSRYDRDVRKYPSRMMLGTETMVADLPYNWERVKKYPQLIGDFVWSGWDYLGEACIGDWTYYSYKGLPLLAGQGMIDITGKPLASMAFMQTVWGMRKEPYISVIPLNHNGETPKKGAWQFTNGIQSWNWRGYEGKKTIVEVYADADSVVLQLNGKKLGKKKVKEFKALFNFKYQNGTLTAIALGQSGKEISRSELKTGKGKHLVIHQDKTTLKKDGQSLCYSEIEFVDDEGNLLPAIEQKVEITIKGKGVVLQGFGSALCKTDEVFDKNYHNSYRGRCLAVLRSTFEEGKATITATSEGVDSVKKTIEVK